MFCPNCGNNCGDAKFCVKCGTKIQQKAAASTAWAPGMACPHCGGTKLEGQNCAFCGAVLQEQVCTEPVEEIVFPAPPMGKYYFWGREGYIIISDHYIKIFRIAIPEWNWIRKDRIIYYKDLYSMKFEPAKTHRGGLLSMRTWDERHVPFPTSKREGEADECSICFSPRDNAQFYEIALFLQKCVRIANKARKL